jgi:hypothetical protein
VKVVTAMMLGFVFVIVMLLFLHGCGGYAYALESPRATAARSSLQQCEGLATQIDVWTVLGAAGTAAGAAATSVIPALPSGTPVLGTTIASAALGLFGGIALVVSRVLDNRFSRGCARSP